MSNQQRKVGEGLRQAHHLKIAIRSEATKGEYLRGLYNGFEIISSIMENREPVLMTNEVLKKEEEKDEHLF